MNHLLLVGDFGGTNVRLAAAERGRDGAIALHAMRSTPASEHASPEAAISSWLQEARLPIKGASLAAAGPSGADAIALTNNAWVLSAPDLISQFAIPVRLENDLAALARAVPDAAPERFETLLAGTTRPDDPIVVLGPGTGLGLAIVARQAKRWFVLATEGGHRAFAPETAQERALLERLAIAQGFVSVEDLVSGPGLERIHAALGGEPKPAPAIGAAALAGEATSLHAATSLSLILAGFARDSTLCAGARGGCILAGGVADALAPLLRSEAFARRFRTHPAMQAYLADIPVRRMLDPVASLKGAALLFWDALEP